MSLCVHISVIGREPISFTSFLSVKGLGTPTTIFSQQKYSQEREISNNRNQQ